MRRKTSRFKRAGAALLLALVGPQALAADEVKHSVQGDTLEIDGAIDARSADIIGAFIDGGGRRIVIDSPGGDSVAGYRIAEKLSAAEVEVVVRRYCLSACANYVFVPARRKSLEEGALIGFHGGLGGPMRTRLEDLPAEVREAARPLFEAQAKEVELFRRIGVDTALFLARGKLTPKPRISKTLSCGGGSERSYGSEAALERALAACMKRKQKYLLTVTSENGLESAAYFPSRQTLERHGVRGIGAYAYPSDRAGLRRLADGLGFRLELAGDVD